MKTFKLKIRVDEVANHTFISFANHAATLRWWDDFRIPSVIAIYAIPDHITPTEVIRAFEKTTDVSWLGGRIGRTEYFWNEMGTIIHTPFPRMFMNISSGNVAPYEEWYASGDDGCVINYVDLGSVVEVKYVKDEWVEV